MERVIETDGIRAVPTDRELRARMVLRLACTRVGLDWSQATVIRLGENALFRLGGGLVARIARPGHLAVAAKETAVARWLAECGVPAVRAVEDITQPLEISGSAVTFWHELPAHRQSTPEQLAWAIRTLHGLAPPQDFTLGPVEPFVRLSQRIWRSTTLTEADRRWLRARLAWLQRRWQARGSGLADRVVHGDAWSGNVLCTADGTVVLADLERFAFGPPEWDLAHTAIKHTSFGWIDAEEYADFCTIYRHDVSTSPDFELYRDIREFRMTCSAAQLAAEDPRYAAQAELRLASLRGERGPRPWPGWFPIR